MEISSANFTQIRRFLKHRLQFDFTTFHGHEAERDNIFQVMKRTAEVGESNSLLLIGPRGAGKTTLINAVLTDLLSCNDFVQNTLVVHLDGNLHTDDRLALKSITIQLQLENASNGKVFGSFAENLAYLLASLKAGDKMSKSVIFILEEFDLFCAHHNQTLLYNLFDVSQSAQAPICVIGITCRLDVIELLEKRVKSRFSHRQIFLFPNGNDFEQYLAQFRNLLSLPTENVSTSELTSKHKIEKKIARTWNKHIQKISNENSVKNALEALYDFNVTEAFLKIFLYKLVAQSQISAENIVQLADSYNADDKVKLLLGLSVLEICIVIAIKHHSEIYDRDPFNFEIIHARFAKFAKTSSSMKGIECAVALKAFEHLRNVELILPLTAACGNKLQKVFTMHKLLLTYGQINEAVQKYQGLPTEVAQWAQSSLI